MITFVTVMGGFHRWFLERRFMSEPMFREDDLQFKITIEAPNPSVAAELLCRLKSELEPLMVGAFPAPQRLDFNLPFEIMGIVVEFKHR